MKNGKKKDVSQIQARLLEQLNEKWLSCEIIWRERYC
jgi:hypothetical protein